MRWASAIVTTLVVVSSGPLSSAAAEREAGIGIGLRAGPAEPVGWVYLPVVLPVSIAFHEHGVVATKIELSEGYAALRSGLVGRACTIRRTQCIAAEASIGVASADLGRDRRSAALLTGATLSYRQGLGSSSFAVRVEGELIAALTGDGWLRGVGMGAFLVRSF